MDDSYAILAGRSIMVVDDSQAITALVRDVFTSCGSAVTCVHCGRSAMLQMQLAKVDLLVLDLKMPDPSGWDVLAFLKLTKPGILHRTILLTGDKYHGGSGLTVDGICIPAVFKPFNVDDLRRAACDRIIENETLALATG